MGSTLDLKNAKSGDTGDGFELAGWQGFWESADDGSAPSTRRTAASAGRKFVGMRFRRRTVLERWSSGKASAPVHQQTECAGNGRGLRFGLFRGRRGRGEKVSGVNEQFVRFGIEGPVASAEFGFHGFDD